MGGKGAGRQKSVLDLGGKGVFVISVGKRVFFILGGKRVFISVGGKGVFATGGKGVFVICGKSSGGKRSGLNGVAAVQSIPMLYTFCAITYFFLWMCVVTFNITF